MPISCTTSQNNELFWEGSYCLKSLVICDSRFESQIAIAIKSRDLEHLGEGSLILRGRFSGFLPSFLEVFRGFKRLSEVLRGFQRYSEIFERVSEIFKRVFRDFRETLSEADFPLRGSESCCPYSCCPLNFLQLVHHIAAMQSAVMRIADFVHCDWFLLFGGCAKGAEKASCGETVVQTGVLGDSVSSLPP